MRSLGGSAWSTEFYWSDGERTARSSAGRACDRSRHRRSSECAGLTSSGEQACEKVAYCRWAGQTFWTIQNSWGDDWSDGGYANYGPRDHDTLNMESAAFYANVKRVHGGVEIGADGKEQVDSSADAGGRKELKKFYSSSSGGGGRKD